MLNLSKLRASMIGGFVFLTVDLLFNLLKDLMLLSQIARLTMTICHRSL